MKINLFRFLSALTFLTKIPVSYNPSMKEDDFEKNIIYFPVVGSVLGILLLSALCIIEIKFSSLMSAFLVVALYVMLTGGLHLDGVGDSFDGLFSYKAKPQILEVMKDPRMGSNGVLGILLILGAKVFAIDNLIGEISYMPIILMPILGRFALVVACYKGKNARENGMGKTYIGNISKKDFLLSIIITTFIIGSIILISRNILFIVNVNAALVAIVLSLIYVLLLRSFVYKKIDGITGDILGLVCESSEAFFLIVCLLIS